MKATARTRCGARPHLVERLKPQTKPAPCRSNKVYDAWFLALFRELGANQATYGYERDGGHYGQEGAQPVIDCVKRRFNKIDRLPHAVEWFGDFHNLSQHHKLICFWFKQIRS